MRGLGVTAAAAHAVPQAAVPVLVFVTTFGSPAFVAVAAAVVYWLGPRYGLLDRREAATVLAITYVALSAVLLLKTAFALPRPPASVMHIGANGYGFPSGHATGSTAFYGSLAVFLRRGDRRLRYALGTLAFVIVALSRVLLGVHYLVDVVAGIALGLLVLVVVRAVAADTLPLAFALAVPLALGGATLWPNAESGLQVGLVTGATVGWWLVKGRRPSASSPSFARAGIGLLVGGALVGVGYASANPIVAGLTGLATGTVFLVLPAVGAQKVSR